MTSKREQALTALGKLVIETLPAADVERNNFDRDEVGKGGLIIVADGDPGEPEVTLSPATYYWSHRAEIYVMVSGSKSTERDLQMDTIAAQIAAALEDDPTLGDVVENAQAIRLDIEEEPVVGGQNTKGAVLQILLNFETTSPIG